MFEESLLFALVFVSGFTGLVYQVCWQKYLEMFLGGHAAASACVLATFFFALALGNIVIGRWGPAYFKNRIMLYAALEAAIGLYALVSIDYFHFLDRHLHYSTSLSSEIGMGFVMSLLFMGLPSFLMGGTIPALTQGLSKQFDAGHRVHARVYSTNTLGAFLGAVLTSIFFIEIWGLPITIFHAGFLNLVIAFIAWLVFQRHGKTYSGFEPITQKTKKKIPQSIWILCFTAFVSGTAFFLIEGLLIRMAGLALGSSTYTYGMVVGGFILAIGAGSSAASHIKKLTPNFLFLYSSTLWLACAGQYLGIPLWPALFLRVRTIFQGTLINFQLYWIAVCAVFAFILFVPVGLLGVNLPILFGSLKNRDENFARTAGRMYGFNAAGCVLGSILSYVLFIFFSADTVYKVALGIIAFIPLLFFASRIDTPEPNRKRLKQGSVLTSLTLVILTYILPNWAISEFVPGRFMTFSAPVAETSFSHFLKQATNSDNLKWLFSKYDPHLHVAAIEDNSGVWLYVNGKPDSYTASDYKVRALNALISASLAPKLDNVFIVGMGAGLGPSLVAGFSESKHLDIAEISQAVIDVQPFFQKYNHPKWSDNKSKATIINGDAFQILRGSNTKYDLIISEPSNTWVAGVDKLFTTEFLATASQHLTYRGLYAQWLPLFAITESTLRSVISSFSHSFKECSIWNTEGLTVLILCSNQEIKPDLTLIAKRFNEQRDRFQSLNIYNPNTLLAFQMTSAGLFKDIGDSSNREHTLENPSLQFESNRAYFANLIVNFEAFLDAGDFPRLNVDSQYQFLYDPLIQNIGANFFHDSLKFFGQYDVNPLIRRRLGLLYRHFYPSESHDLHGPNIDTLELLEALMVNNQKLLLDRVRTPAQASLLLRTYSQLLVSQIPVLVPGLGAKLLPDCKYKICEGLKETLIKTFP